MITKDDVIAWCETAKVKYADKVNPVDGVICIYDDGKGNHCIVGQFLADHGLPMPPMNEMIFGSRGNYAMDVEAASLLHLLQFTADNSSGHVVPPTPIKWSEAIRRSVDDLDIAAES